MLGEQKNPENEVQIVQNIKSSNHSIQTIKQQNPRESGYQPSAQKNQIQLLSTILQKSSDARTVYDNHTITNFIRQNIVLQKLCQLISFQFIKDIMKYCAIVVPGKDKIIFKKGDEIKFMGLVLVGQLAIVSESENSGPIPTQISNEDVIDHLFENAKNYHREYSKKLNNINLSVSRKIKQQSQMIQKNYQNYQLTNYQKISTIINQNQLYGFYDRSIGQNYMNTCICLKKQTILLVFNEINIMSNLQIAFKQKQRKTTTIMKGISCFNILDPHRIISIIQSLAIRKKKKPFAIYHQGQPSLFFYILVQGQVKIKKQTYFVQENSKILPTKKHKLADQNMIKKRKTPSYIQKNGKYQIGQNSYSYTDRGPLVNYRPIKKTIQIGIVTPISLFGEEEYMEKKHRENSAICESLEVEYLQINIKKLEAIIGPKLLPNFCQQVYELSRKKLLYHNYLYKTAVELQNKNSISLLVDDENDTTEQQKKNSIQNSPDMSKKRGSSSYNMHNSNLIQKQSDKKLSIYQKQSDKKLGRSSKKSLQQKQTNYTIDQNQKKLIQISHTWKYMKQKIDKRLQTMNKISPVKLSINLKKPLLNSQFFIHIQKQSRRINKQHRRRITSLSNSFKIRNHKKRNNLLFKE